MFEVQADDSALGVKLMEIEARLTAASSVLSQLASGTAAAIGQALGSIDLSRFNAAIGAAGSSFSSVIGGMTGLSNEASQSIKINFVDFLGNAFQSFGKTITSSLLPPISSAVSVVEKLLSLFSKAENAAKSTADNDVWKRLASLGDMADASLGAVQGGVSGTAAAASPSVRVDLNAKLYADGYELAKVTMRNLDDAAGLM